jgi:hypothetical protein
MQPVMDEMGRLAPSAGLSAADMQSMIEMYAELLGRFNLLVALRTLPVGVSSLMSGRMPVISPLGLPAVLQVESLGQLMGLFLILTLLGWLLGGLYFYRVAGWYCPGPLRRFCHSPGAVVQTILCSLIWAGLFWTLGVPALFIIYVSFAINSVLGQGLLLFLGFAALWLLVPLFFSPHGIYIRKQNAFASFLGGFQLTRLTLPSSSMFVLVVFLVGFGLNLCGVLSEIVALVGVLGHAFITTASCSLVHLLPGDVHLASGSPGAGEIRIASPEGLIFAHVRRSRIPHGTRPGEHLAAPIGGIFTSGTKEVERQQL